MIKLKKDMKVNKIKNKKVTLLEKCREFSGLSKKKMAKSIGISYVGYCKYEQRVGQPKLSTFYKITKLIDKNKLYIKFDMQKFEFHNKLMNDFLMK